MNNSLKDAVEALLSADNILIITHKSPDGDTAGCAGALALGLRQLGKKAFVLKNPEITPRYADLIDFAIASDDFKPDFVVAVDMADTGLMTENAKVFEGKIDLVLDHHRSNSNFGKINIVVPSYAACGELICDVLTEMNVKIDKEIAYPLYVSVSTDTGCFKYSNTTANTHRVAAICLETGFDGGEVNRRLFETKTRRRIEMEKLILQNIKFLHGDKIAIVTILLSDIEKTGADEDDLDSIAALPRQIEGVEMGITVKEKIGNTVKISVRTAQELDASAFCAKFGGGGHLRAAGASLKGDVDTCLKNIISEAEKIYA